MKLPWTKKSAPAQPSNLDPSSDLFAALLMATANKAGVKVTPLTALGVATVFSCVNVISRTLSTLPLKLYQRGDNGARSEAREHRLFDLLHLAPNGEMTSADFRCAVQSNLSLRNNAYVQIRRNLRGEVVDLTPLQTSEVSPIREAGQLVYKVKSGTSSRTLRAHEVIALRTMTLNGITGLDPTSTCSEVIGLAIALDTNAAKFFGNSSRPGLILETPETLTDEAYQRLKKSMDDKHGGVENAYRTMILEGGLKAANQRSDNHNSQFDQSRERQDKQIARLFCVPPHKVGIMGDATFSNIEQQNIEFVTDCIRPLVTVWEQALNKALLTPEERKTYFIEFNLDGLLRGDIATRFEAYNKAFLNGWLSVNEIRELENRNPVEGGDQHFRPLNLTRLDAPTDSNTPTA